VGAFQRLNRVAQDGKYLKVDEQLEPYIFCPMAQASRPETTLIVETSVAVTRT